MKTALITGAGRGIGRSLAVDLAKQGYTLFLVSKSKEALAKTKELCVNEGVSVFAAVCDIRDKDSVFQLKDKVIETLEKVDFIFNCAAIAHERNFSDESLHDMERIMDTNFYGSVYFTKAFLPHLMDKGGHIVFINSESLSQGGRASYSASKSALSGFGESLEEEFEGSNVRVSNIYLPPVVTKLFKDPTQNFSNHISKEEAAIRILADIGLIEAPIERPGFFGKLFGK